MIQHYIETHWGWLRLKGFRQQFYVDHSKEFEAWLWKVWDGGMDPQQIEYHEDKWGNYYYLVSGPARNANYDIPKPA